ncbi:MAG: hypothetical protein CVT88_04380 [Candidatus Altiarchaeales archaeon HGW-Altiarchaeales-1]|nr:MAG: hypothetical protein CVT88_04380 [Candidatus Altiarchaeales archaeon HGW-Altiarchaeales-1]
MDLDELIKKGESEEIEFKKSLAERKEILETISAFANSRGGTIFVGIEENRNGSVKDIPGIVIKGKEIEDLSNEIRQNTDPVIFPSIEVKDIKGKPVLVIKVNKNPLTVFATLNKIPVAFKRVGKTNPKIDVNELRRIFSESKEFIWDFRICEEATLTDIDWEFVEKFFMPLYETISEKNIISGLENLLESLHCLKENKPTNAGILLFGKDPQKFFMNSYVALARYRGNEIGIERLDYKEFSGNLFQQIDNCDKYIKEHIAIMSRLLPYRVRREDIPEYGLFSIRELITNAVCHRDYSNPHTKVIIKMFSNRIELYNPGCLPGEVTPDNITEKQYSRNSVIARVLAKVDYIEDMGEGWNKIIDEHKKHILKPELPSIKADRDSVLITLFSTKDKFEEEKFEVELNHRQKRAIEHIKKYGKITNKDYRKLFLEISDRTVLGDLTDLVRKEILTKKGRTKGAYYIIHNSEIIPK